MSVASSTDGQPHAAGRAEHEHALARLQVGDGAQRVHGGGVRHAERGRVAQVDRVRDHVDARGVDHDLLRVRTHEAGAVHVVADRDAARHRRRPRSITPENSLPGTNGAGTCTWYSLLTMSTSGKFTAAYAMSTSTSPGPGVGSGSS